MVLGQTNKSKPDSLAESYWSSSKTKLSAGWQSQYEPKMNKSSALVSLSYLMSHFYYPPEIIPNQIGLYNELGLSNSEIYFEFGPEIRLFKNLYIIPQGRVSFAWIAGVDRGGIGFLYFFGGRIGFNQQLSSKTILSFEIGTRVLPIDDNQNIFFANVGLLIDFF